MNTFKNYTKIITVSKDGIHNVISELVTKFNLDKFLFPNKYTIAFIALCIDIILFYNSTTTYIADKLS